MLMQKREEAPFFLRERGSRLLIQFSLHVRVYADANALREREREKAPLVRLEKVEFK